MIQDFLSAMISIAAITAKSSGDIVNWFKLVVGLRSLFEQHKHKTGLYTFDTFIEI